MSIVAVQDWLNGSESNTQHGSLEAVTRLRVVAGLDVVAERLLATADAVVADAEGMDEEPSPAVLAAMIQAELARLGRPFRSLEEKWSVEDRLVRAWREQRPLS